MFDKITETLENALKKLRRVKRLAAKNGDCLTAVAMNDIEGDIIDAIESIKEYKEGDKSE